MKRNILMSCLVLAGIVSASSAMASTCADLPKAAELKTALMNAMADPAGNGGLHFPTWLTLVSSSGTVCAVVHSIDPTTPGFDVTQDLAVTHRLLSAQKAYTANSFSHNGVAVNSGNLFSGSAPGGAASNYHFDNYTLNPFVSPATYGTATDPMIGKIMGGFNSHGGGLALFNASHKKVGAIGVSGDTGCTSHVIAWKVREQLTNFQGANIPFGLSATHDDKLILDVSVDTVNGTPGYSPSGLGHPACTFSPTAAQAAGSIEFH